MLVNLDRIRQWLPGAARHGAVGLVLLARLAAGPITAHPHVVPSTPTTTGPSVASVIAQSQTVKPAPIPTPSTPSVPPAQTQAPAPEPAAPSPSQLMSTGGPTTDQSTFTPTTEQVNNAKAIIAAGQQMNLPPRAWVIAVATSLQETKLHNYGNLGAGNDHDSLGLFQQRPSSGWGSPQQLTDPTYAATAFYKGLEQVPGWQSLPLTDAAQAVQVSAYGDRYAQWEQQAADLVLADYGTGPYAAQAK